MKKIFLVVIVCFLVCNNSISSNFFDLKSKIDLIEKETNTYSGENIPIENRIRNAELYVFGSSKSGDLNTRVNNLSVVLGLPVNTDSKDEVIYEIENDIRANYPSVDKIENQIFGRTYEKENIYMRLERLEKKLFGKVSSKSLQERVLILQDNVPHEKIIQKISPHSHNNNQYDYDYGEYNYYSSKTESPEVSIMEKKLFGKNFENEQMSKRLSRLENKLFGKSFDSQSDSVRTERLKSVYKAAKSGTEYKVNKFAKYAIAGAQIGGILLFILAMIL